jgi:hypothetical protein
MKQIPLDLSVGLDGATLPSISSLQKKLQEEV